MLVTISDGQACETPVSPFELAIAARQSKLEQWTLAAWLCLCHPRNQQRRNRRWNGGKHKQDLVRKGMRDELSAGHRPNHLTRAAHAPAPPPPRVPPVGGVNQNRARRHPR